jgi:uncharacterized protein
MTKLHCLLAGMATLALGLDARLDGAERTLKALIIDGQNNHAWKATTPVLKKILEDSDLFKVDVATAPGGKDLGEFKPNFKDYNVVVSNYNGAPWSAETQKAFVDYVRWKDGQFVRDTSPGNGGSHGRQHAFQMIVRDEKHPITAGLPTEWMHANDELYDRLRGPAKDMTVLATAFSDKKTGGTGEHEPLLMAIKYGDGRVFHTALGHDVGAMKCVGFIVTLLRGAEWAATGKVTQTKVPEDFPSSDKVSTRP